MKHELHGNAPSQVTFIYIALLTTVLCMNAFNERRSLNSFIFSPNTELNESSFIFSPNTELNESLERERERALTLSGMNEQHAQFTFTLI